MPSKFLGVDHADVRVASLASVEAFYDGLLPALGLPHKTFAFVDEHGEWFEPSDARPYNTVEFHEDLVPGQSERFIGIIEDASTVPSKTRLAFTVASKPEVERWRDRLRELGARDIETENNFDDYPALFFNDPGGTRLEICARNPKS